MSAEERTGRELIKLWNAQAVELELVRPVSFQENFRELVAGSVIVIANEKPKEEVFILRTGWAEQGHPVI